MNAALLKPEIQDFIRSYSDELSALAFKGSPFKDVSVQELISQIEGFRKTEKKLPLWHNTKGIYFPPRLNIEQTSSEITAQYKASLVSGTRLADITGGLGVDSFYFAQRFEMVDHFEKDVSLSEIAAYNFKCLQANTINCSPTDAFTALAGQSYDVIFADPARRHDVKGKVFLLKDCEPNLNQHSKMLLEHAKTLLIKTSPMLDISMGLEELGDVREIHVVAVDNEVKELLWVLERAPSATLSITAINFNKGAPEKFTFNPAEPSDTSYALPQQYLYEPNAAIMKAGGFDYLSQAFQVSKLHRHSHLFTSEVLVDFPGRVFKIGSVVPYHKKVMKEQFRGTKANITTRNFPISVQELRTKWKIKEGGDTYLFGTTLMDDVKVVLVCKKIFV